MLDRVQLVKVLNIKVLQQKLAKIKGKETQNSYDQNNIV